MHLRCNQRCCASGREVLYKRPISCGPKVLQGERLANWVREHGGYVHEALALSNATDCGSRCSSCRSTSTAAAAPYANQQLNVRSCSPRNDIRLEHDNPLRCRGIVAREAIAGEDAQLPLVLVPEQLYLTAAVADRLMSPALQRAGRPPVRDSLNPGLALAALLAHQR